MNRHLRLVVASTLVWLTSWAHAQALGPQPPAARNVMQLSASATVEVPQDWLTLTLSTSRTGSDAAVIQTQLKQALDKALTAARRQAEDGQLDVHTGNFQLSPRYSREGGITGWQGSAELVLEGRDFVRIASLAGSIPSLTVSGAQFSLSRAAHDRVAVQAQSSAIERFKSKASEIAKGFGFSTYTLLEVSVSGDDQVTQPRPRMMAMQAKSEVADAPVPLEAGKSTVAVTVSGSVQLQ